MSIALGVIAAEKREQRNKEMLSLLEGIISKYANMGEFECEVNMEDLVFAWNSKTNVDECIPPDLMDNILEDFLNYIRINSFEVDEHPIDVAEKWKFAKINWKKVGVVA